MGPGATLDRATTAADVLAPYVPRLVIDWLTDSPQVIHRRVPGSCAFADISGFTVLTERLAKRGKVGAEEMGDLLNAAFDELLSAAYDYGANLVKWGGDAVLLLFEGDAHAQLAARAGWAMQDTMRRIGRLQTSCGVVRLGMSIGVHSGDFDFLLTGNRYRELIVTGPGATMTARMEKTAERGQVVLSPSTASLLATECVGPMSGEGYRLVGAPLVGLMPNRTPKRPGLKLDDAFCAPLREHLLGGSVDHEHRNVTIGFIEFSGTDELLRTHGSQALCDAVTYVVDAVQEAAEDNAVTILGTDLCENGGKIIVVSGAPRTVGDDETRVLSTVRRVVHPGGRLALRAGVTCGPVFAGDYGPFYRRVYSVTGDIVNLAARLMGKAAPGQVLATPAVVERSRSSFETTALAPFAVKGKVAPVEALLVGDLRRVSAPARPNRIALIGRDRELSSLLDAAQLAAAGQGQLVELVAPPGMGKSRLLEEFTDRIDARVLWADGDIYGTATPYQPMQRLLRRTLGLPDDVADDVLAAVLVDLIGGTAPDLAPWLPLIAIVAGVDLPATVEVDGLDPEIRKARLEAVTSEALGRLLMMPIVMIFNDLSVMDEATLDLLGRLAADVGDRPWLIVTTRRPDSRTPLASNDRLRTIELAPLDAVAAHELLTAATEDAVLPPHRMQQLLDRSGGNPLFLRELIAGALAGDAFDDLPESVEGVIAARIDRLAPDRRRWLRAAAVLGTTVDLDLLAEVLDDPLAGADVLAWSDMAEFITPGIDGLWRFSHHLIRATAYEGLPYRRRTSLHARAAEVIERRAGARAAGQADLLSLHCLHGGQFEAAWRYSTLAGDRAREHYAGAEAAQCYRRALAAAPHVSALDECDLSDVCEALADVCSDLGEITAADAALARARASARTDPHRTARLRLKTARNRQHVGRHTDALRWVSRGRSVIATATAPAALRLRAELAELCALIRYDQGNSAEAMRWARRSVEEARHCGDRLTEARGLEVCAVIEAKLGLPWNHQQVMTSLALYEELGDLRGKARASNRFGACAYYSGRWDEAVSHYAAAEHAYRAIGRESAAAINAANAAEVLIDQGRHEQATPALRAAIRIWLAADATSFLAFGTALLGQAAVLRGEYADAMTHFANARALCVVMGEVEEMLAIDARAAHCHLRAGDIDSALELADLAVARAGDAAPSLALLLRVRGEALVTRGQPREGHVVLREALSVAHDHQQRAELAAVLEALLRLDAAADENEAAAWRRQRFALHAALGIMSV